MTTLSRNLDADQLAVIDALRAAIEASGLTQKDFAKAIGTSPVSLPTCTATPLRPPLCS